MKSGGEDIVGPPPAATVPLLEPVGRPATRKGGPAETAAHIDCLRSGNPERKVEGVDVTAGRFRGTIPPLFKAWHGL